MNAFIPPYIRSLQDPVLINFPKRINFTRTTAQRFYLPPEVPSILLPEVIDNRLRSSSWINYDKLVQPDLGLQIPLKNSPKDNFYNSQPSYTETKQNSNLNSQEFDSVPLTVNEMSCRNSGDKFYFK